MKHNNPYNKFIFERLLAQKDRIKWSIPTQNVFTDYIMEHLSVKETEEAMHLTKNITEDILDNEAVLRETLKFIGIMEVCSSEEELIALLNRRTEIKYGKPLTDFNEILKAALVVPKPKK